MAGGLLDEADPVASLLALRLVGRRVDHRDMSTEVREAIPESSRPEVRLRRRWPWGSAATDDHPLHHEMTPHRQVQLLWLVTTFAVVAVAFVTPLALRGAKNDLHTATARLVPASTER